MSNYYSCIGNKVCYFFLKGIYAFKDENGYWVFGKDINKPWDFLLKATKQTEYPYQSDTYITKDDEIITQNINKIYLEQEEQQLTRHAIAS